MDVTEDDFDDGLDRETNLLVQQLENLWGIRPRMRVTHCNVFAADLHKRFVDEWVLALVKSSSSK